MSWAGHIVSMGERRGLYRVLVVEDHLEDTGVDGRIILRWIFRKWDVGVWSGSSWLRIWTFVFHEMRGISWLTGNVKLLEMDTASWSTKVDEVIVKRESPLVVHNVFHQNAPCSYARDRIDSSTFRTWLPSTEQQENQDVRPTSILCRCVIINAIYSILLPF